MKAPLANVRGTPLIALVLVSSSCGFLLFGYDNGVLSGILVCPWFLETFNPDAVLKGTVSAMYNAGAFLGSIVAFFLGSKLGRRMSLLFGLSITTAGAVVQCSATGYAQLIVGRIVTGLGVGVMTSTVGLWQGEIVPAKTRGFYLTLQVFLGAHWGLFLAQWINYGFSSHAGRVAFVFPLAFQFVFLVLAIALILCGLPESPRWLYNVGRRQEAFEVLLRLESSKHEPTRRENAKSRYLEIEEAYKLERRNAPNQYTALFKGGPTQNFRRVCLACATMTFHQLTGVNTVTYYMPTLIERYIGASQGTSLWITGILSTVDLPTDFVGIFTVDRFGRRVYLWGGAAFQCIMFIVVASVLASQDALGAHKAGVITVVFLFLFFACFSMSWLGPSWAYPAEILPLHIREKGLALGNVFYWAFQVMIVEVTPIAINNIGYKFYIILAVFNACIAVTVYFFWPETKGLSLEEIDFYFAERYNGGQELREVEAEVAQEKETTLQELVENIPQGQTTVNI